MTGGAALFRMWTLSIERDGEVFTVGDTRHDAMLLDGLYGFDDGVSENQLTTSPGLPGGLLTGRRVPVREVFVPCRLNSKGPGQWRELSARLRRITGGGGAVTLTVTSQWGDRSIVGHRSLADSATWDVGTIHVAAGRQRVGLLFDCPDPYWSSDPVVVEWSNPPPQSVFPILPLKLSRSSVLGETQELDLGGDGSPSGRWEFAGPWRRAVVTDATTGRSFTLVPPRPVTADEVVTVHTDPQAPMKVVGPDGASAFTWLQSPFDVWPLSPRTTVKVLMEDTVPAQSWAQLVATPRWESAL